MKVWLVMDEEYDESDIGAGYLFVVRAADEQSARAFVAKTERRKWWLKYGICEELGAKGEPGIVASAHVNP